MVAAQPKAIMQIAMCNLKACDQMLPSLNPSLIRHKCSSGGLLIYRADFKCSHSVGVLADQWPDKVRLTDIEPHCVCTACGKRGADVRPDFYWNSKPAAAMGYR
jgi:hypothetical protein